MLQAFLRPNELIHNDLKDPEGILQRFVKPCIVRQHEVKTMTIIKCYINKKKHNDLNTKEPQDEYAFYPFYLAKLQP